MHIADDVERTNVVSYCDEWTKGMEVEDPYLFVKFFTCNNESALQGCFRRFGYLGVTR